MVTNAGLAAITDAIRTGSGLGTYYIGVGTDATAEAAGDTDLGSEVGTRILATESEADDYTLQLDATWQNDTGAQVVIAEAGVFTALTGGTLIAREVPTSTSTVPNGSNLDVTITLPVSAS